MRETSQRPSVAGHVSLGSPSRHTILRKRSSFLPRAAWAATTTTSAGTGVRGKMRHGATRQTRFTNGSAAPSRAVPASQRRVVQSGAARPTTPRICSPRSSSCHRSASPSWSAPYASFASGVAGGKSRPVPRPLGLNGRAFAVPRVRSPFSASSSPAWPERRCSSTQTTSGSRGPPTRCCLCNRLAYSLACCSCDRVTAVSRCWRGS